MGSLGTVLRVIVISTQNKHNFYLSFFNLKKSRTFPLAPKIVLVSYLTIDSDRCKLLNDCIVRKLLRPRDYLLLGLANILDLAEDVKDPLGFVSKSYENMYGWIPGQYKRHNFNHLVWRNLKTGYIEKIIRDNQPYFRLTSSGKNKLTRDFPFLGFQNKGWDKKWRLVVFDVEETNKQARERFRNKLKELGFGMLQESVFISPYDIAKDFTEFIDVQGLNESAYLLVVSTIAVGDIKALVNRVWHLDKMNDFYKKIIRKIEDNDLIFNSDRLNKLNDKDVKKVQDLTRDIKKEYLEAMLDDPFLPKELLPLDWEGKRAGNLVKKLFNIRQRPHKNIK